MRWLTTFTKAYANANIPLCRHGVTASLTALATLEHPSPSFRIGLHTNWCTLSASNNRSTLTVTVSATVTWKYTVSSCLIWKMFRCKPACVYHRIKIVQPCLCRCLSLSVQIAWTFLFVESTYNCSLQSNAWPRTTLQWEFGWCSSYIDAKWIQSGRSRKKCW